MDSSLLLTVILPLSLFIIMLGMGMSLVIDDFKQVLSQPKAFLVGITAQMLLLPALCFLVVSFVDIDPLLAVGLMVLSFCPGGTTSNLFSFLAKGDVALSIVLTAVVSVIAPFTVPWLTMLSTDYFLGSGSGFSLPAGKTIVQLLIITVFPVILGMLLNKWKPKFCATTQAGVKVFSLVFLLIIILGVVSKNWENIFNYSQQLALPVLLLNISAMLLGFLLSCLCHLRYRQTITISYEVGIQNGTTAILITSTLLGSDAMSMSPIIYSLLMLVTGGALGGVFKYFTARNLRYP